VSNVVGTVQFKAGSRLVIASLDVLHGWVCTDQHLQALLNTDYTDYEPAQGRPGLYLLRKAARELNGTVVSVAEDDSEATPDALY